METPEDSSSKTIREFDGKSHRKVGLVYDEIMCKHDTPDGNDHPECPYRVRAIWNKLKLAGVVQRCVVLSGSRAEDKHLQLVHTKNHVALIKNISSQQYSSTRQKIASQFNSIYLNGGSSDAAFLAAGSVVEVGEKVAKGELDSAFAIVRPPGHHAEEDEAMGFCLFNNVAVAASYLLNERPDLGVKKILIVDWDVHHGNGTQKMFWKDPRVLFFSVHRHEDGSFYPANDDGFYSMIGEGPGKGYNINVPWEQGRCGDADYLAVWDHILIPVAKEFNPDIIFISAGFDAAVGDPLGGCRVTPYGYSIMLQKLMVFAQGKIVMALEGGYNLDSNAYSSLACVQVLLGDKPLQGSSEVYPFESTWRVIQQVRKRLCVFWHSLAGELPSLWINHTSTSGTLISSFDSETEDGGDPHVPEPVNISEGVLEQISKLSIQNHQDADSSSWRTDLGKVEVWYATYGSNMWKPRFLCYIQGGKVEGMKRECVGSMDKRPPKEIVWETFEHRLFFGHESTVTWGEGGVAFLDPMRNHGDKSHLCMYRITLEQFNDVLFQENGMKVEAESALLSLADVELIGRKGSLTIDAAKDGWYGNVVYLGDQRGLPILTMTCPVSDVDKFKRGEYSLRPPAQPYANTLIRGLVEGGRLSPPDAAAYIHTAASTPLSHPHPCAFF